MSLRFIKKIRFLLMIMYNTDIVLKAFFFIFFFLLGYGRAVKFDKGSLSYGCYIRVISPVILLYYSCFLDKKVKESESDFTRHAHVMIWDSEKFHSEPFSMLRQRQIAKSLEFGFILRILPSHQVSFTVKNFISNTLINTTVLFSDVVTLLLTLVYII